MIFINMSEKINTEKFILRAKEIHKIMDDEVEAAEKAGKASKSQQYKKGGKVGSASARADGCCIRGKTRA